LHFDTVSAGWVLLGIVVISGIPLILLLLEGTAAGGGSVEVGVVKIALTAGANQQRPVVVPANVAPPGTPISDSGSSSILKTLRDARMSGLVVVDLEQGSAWWETRLLLVCAGAARLGRPQVIVFVAYLAGRPKQFVGWAKASELLEVLLSDKRYRLCFQRAEALAAAARLTVASPPPVTVTLPSNREWMVYEPDAADPTAAKVLQPFLNEQLLANELAALENTPLEIDASRARDRFGTVLHRGSVDQTDRDVDWFRKALLDEDDYLSITDRGTYVGLMPRKAIVSAVLLQLAAS
jgi:hypothetical protein